MTLHSPSSPIINQPKTWCSGCAVPKDRSSSASALRLLLLRLLIPSYLLLSHAPTTAAGPIQHNCTGGTYAGNSAFQANLNALLASLAFRSSSSNSANTTSGAGADRTYGVYLCEGDLTHYDCQACINTAATDIILSCPSARQAIIWYDYCLLRYSDANFFGVPDAAGFSMVNKNENTSSPVPFQAVANLVQAAPYSSQPLMFASNASAAGSLYAMAQCTADLGSGGCRTCLTTILAGIQACCTGFNGWRYLAASCWIRYENTPFFLELNGTYTEIINHQCSNQPASPATSGLIKNLLSDVASKAGATGFYNATTTAGEGPARLYGLALCRADLPTPGDNCTNCLNEARIRITGDSGCPNMTEGTVWYEKCLLRYSNQSFFGVVDDGGRTYCGLQTVTEAVSSATFAAASRVVGVAASSPLLYGAEQVRVSDSQSSYILAQCTRDLGSGGCRSCLQKGMGMVASNCTQVNGWRYLSGSCTIRYEDFAFFNTTSVILSTGAPPPQPGEEGGEYENTPFFLELNGTYTEIINHQCSNQPASPATSGLIKNLLSDVASKAGATGFYNATTTAGEGPARLYGLALCRADLPTPGDNCTNCLNEARIRITGDSGCPNMTEGTVWYEKCLLRYSNQSFFGVVDDGGRTYCGLQTVTEAVSSATFAAASRVVGVAASSPLLYGAEQVRVSDSQSSYILAQCTRDLGSGGCRSCLQKGMGMVASNCTQVNGWRYLSGSCTIRYEDFAFFNTTSVILSTGAPPPQPGEEGGGSKSSSSLVAEIVAPILGVILLGSLLYYLWRRSKRRHDRSAIELEGFRPLHGKDIPFMDLAIIQAATSNFSDANKLGEGGFGPVYKGVLHGGQEIAVKRLSTKSNQGATEFKNEVKLIAKVQHKNLVRMLGYCVEKKEKLLIYEYLPNRSLDIILFDPNKRSELDWRRRHHIVAGIARGLLYLHEDSLLKVIHRDLKASNVLLDKEMNPKISDFGMAKIFEADENEAANTNRVVGTYGYMAPEYAMDGVFSVKSDVYSFGVLLLEIVSGQKNGRSQFVQHGGNLPRNAWHLWSAGKALELMDPLLGDSYPADEALKLIHIGLLCVQENAEERPTMSSVVLMLQSEKKVPQPTQPPTFSRVSDLSSSSTKNTTNTQSINEVTISDTAPR